MNFDKDPQLAKKLARRQKGLRKKLRKHQFDAVEFDDAGHIGSQDIAEAGWDLTFDNYDEEFEREHEKKKGG